MTREKLWYESKSLRKRAAFLLEDADLIPTDVSFRVGREDSAVLVHGHRMLFGLVSPVFHAMLYGHLKENKIIIIPDITPDAFQCLKTYAYSDSFACVSVENVMDVLAASKKYLISEWTRHCYAFLQSSIGADTAISFWCKAREIADMVVEEQCVAEIKRNADQVVLSKEFLDLPEAKLISLTSWKDIAIKEPDLYRAVKNWKSHQEQRDNTPVEFRRKRRKNDGILQHILFGLFTPEELAAGPVMDGVFSEKDLQELYLHAFGAKELTSFHPSTRVAVPPFFLTVRIFVSTLDEPGDNDSMQWNLFDTMKIVIWADVAPKACQLLRESVEAETGLIFELSLAVERYTSISRKKRGCLTDETVDDAPDPDETGDIEEKSLLWAAPGMVSLKFNDGVPCLTLLTTNELKLNGKSPETLFGVSGDCGMVVGKVLNGPGEHLIQLETYADVAADDFGLPEEDDDRPWIGTQKFSPFRRFECSLLDEKD